MGAGGRLLRPLTLRDENIAALWPLHYAPRGLDTSPFGPQPVRWFQSPSGQAYAFQFHVKDKPQALGNYLIFAPSGGGKSTLMMHLLGGLAKFDGVRSYIFDSKEGARFMVEAMAAYTRAMTAWRSIRWMSATKRRRPATAYTRSCAPCAATST